MDSLPSKKKRKYTYRVRRKTNRDNWLCSHPLYASWNMMKQRCYNKKNEKYPIYGGRGIKVCKKWRGSFWAFAKDMGLRPTPMHSLDRRNTNGNYTPSNCRWATRSEQRMNYRDSIHIEFQGEKFPLKMLAARFGVVYGTAWKRLKEGRPFKQIFSKERCPRAS